VACKAGSFVIPGTSSFSISGLGFKPRWTIFLFSNKGTEDTWLSDACGGIAFTAMRNSTTDTSGVGSSLKTCMVSERWYDAGAVVAGSFLGDVTMWVRATNGSNGWALYTSSIHDDGWNFTFASGFSSGAGGQIVYYLAGDQEWEEVGSTAPFVPGSSAYSLGWQPQAFFGIGAGGGVSSPGNDQSSSFFDISIPSVCYGDWGDYDDQQFDMNGQWRGILDPNVNVQEWWGKTTDFSPTTILEETQAGGVWFSSTFSASRTATTFQGTVLDTGGFSNGHARMMPFVLGTTDSIIGSFTPSTTVGVPTEVVLPFSPQAVVFFSPGDHQAGAFNTSTQGSTGWGFCTDEDEALVIYGGHWNPPVAFQSAVMISSSKSWVGNAKEEGVSGTVGTMVNAGSARCTPAGFEHTTTEHASGAPTWPVLYWAIAPATEAPGFFRVV
jgi:hypothetical protein